MTLAPLTGKLQKYIEKDTNYDEDQTKIKAAQVKEWMSKQPHLPLVPEKIYDNMIRCFLIGCKMSVERVKCKIDTYYAMRHQLPEVFDDRDPTSEIVRDSVKTIKYFPLADLTPDGLRVNILSTSDDKASKFTAKDIVGFLKRVQAIITVRHVQKDLWVGEFIVIDCRGFYLSHISEISWPLVLKFITYIQEGCPFRLKKVCLIHAPSYIETVVNMVKPVMREKFRKRIETFKGDHTNIYKYIPRSILPSDYGGEAPSIEESNSAWQETTESMRDLLKEDEKLRTDESKRPKDSSNHRGQLFGINGTFNKLNID